MSEDIQKFFELTKKGFQIGVVRFGAADYYVLLGVLWIVIGIALIIVFTIQEVQESQREKEVKTLEHVRIVREKPEPTSPVRPAGELYFTEIVTSLFLTSDIL